MYRQAQIAEARFSASNLREVDFCRAYTPDDPTGILVDAIFNNVYRVAEEAANLDIDTMLEFPDYPWSQIRGMRYRMAQEYFDFDGRYLFEALTNDLPLLMDFCLDYSLTRQIDLDAVVVKGSVSVIINERLQNKGNKSHRGPEL